MQTKLIAKSSIVTENKELSSFMWTATNQTPNIIRSGIQIIPLYRVIENGIPFMDCDNPQDGLLV